MLEHTVAQNVSQVRGGALGGFKVWLGRKELARAADRQIRALQIKAPSPWAQVHHLSGGNQQKVVIGKWLLLRPSLLVLDDPTYGVDPGARRSILALVREAAAEGVGVLLFSTEPEQLVATCARVVVVREGRNTHEIAGDRLDLQTLTELAWG